MDGVNPSEVIKATTPNLGDVMSDTDAMQADPEAYKQYFDFYHKYYTQKYAQHGVTNEQIQPTFPNVTQSPPPLCQTNVPPPPLNNTFPSRTQQQSVLSNIKNRNFKQEKKYQPPQSKNYFFDATEQINRENVNKKNYDSAQQMREELKPSPVSGGNSLSSLVQYDLSDSDCEN